MAPRTLETRLSFSGLIWAQRAAKAQILGPENAFPDRTGQFPAHISILFPLGPGIKDLSKSGKESRSTVIKFGPYNERQGQTYDRGSLGQNLCQLSAVLFYEPTVKAQTLDPENDFPRSGQEFGPSRWKLRTLARILSDRDIS